MLVHPQFDPIAFSLGPLAIRWYGLSYLLAFGLFMLLAARRVRRPWYASRGWQRRDVEDMLFYGVLGVIVGGRLGYCFFYKPDYYLQHLPEVLMVWKGGMAFHGGLLGVMIAMALFAKARRRSFLDVMDVVAPCVPIGIAAVRVANFINGELWGRQADPSLPWAMVFPQSGETFARHPSQLYQALLEGLLLFILLQLYGRRERATGQVAAAFVMGYGVLRFTAEYFREPDSFLGLLALGMSMGQWLCVPMIAGGAALWLWCGRQPPRAAVETAVETAVEPGVGQAVGKGKGRAA